MVEAEEGVSLGLFPPNPAGAGDQSTGPPAHCLILTFRKETGKLSKGWGAGLRTRVGSVGVSFRAQDRRLLPGMPGSKPKLSNYLVPVNARSHQTPSTPSQPVPESQANSGPLLPRLTT